ncbi:MAG: YfiT family bacillithiol transferase, partial [Gemmatimonadota bacterium]
MSTTISHQNTDLRYPVGPFVRPDSLDDAQRRAAIASIAETPRLLRAAISGMTAQQLETPYRPGGWTVRQVVHHVADSHISGYTRFKLALTENTPTIKPYQQAEWAELADTKTAPLETSLTLLDALTDRWVRVLRAMSPSDFERLLIHPEHETPLSLDQMLALYEWHGRHHVAHVTLV